jgi:tetratricopeptide (TPR) repeat protein
MSADTDSLLAPNDDKEFEQLCQHVLEHRFKTLYGQAYARSGCAQHGVDFYIETPAKGGKEATAGTQIIGVQCKHKDRALGHELTVEELNAEVQKVKGFRPPLTAFIVATSAPTAKAVQDRANELTVSHSREVPPLFPVTAWFWEKIRHEFAKDETLLTQVLQRFYPHLRSALTPPFNALHQLTPPVSDFTGREAKLDELRKKVKQGGVAITGVRGMGGAGKTELARRLAAELKTDYPDAQFELDLKGMSPQPLSPVDVLCAILRVFRPTAQLPEREKELAALLRQTIEGKRVLLLLDNAKDAHQIAPLLPPPPGCLVLATSRQHFALPGLDAVNLGVMEPPEARSLLLKTAPRIGPEAEALAQTCGRLPLALRLAASSLAVNEHIVPAEYVQHLRDSRQRLQLLDKARELTTEDLGLEASFTLSFQQLPPKQQQQFTRLAVFPTSFDRAAVTAVWAVEESAASDGLDLLLRLSLLEWNPETQRFELHDLLREFARNHAKAEELKAPKRRHAEHFIRVASRAQTLYEKGGENVLAGLALFDRERGHLEAAFDWLDSRRDKESAPLLVSLVNALVYSSSLRFHPRQQICWLEAQANAARLAGDHQAQGVALSNCGIAYFDLGDARKAIEFYEQALVIARELGHRRGEGSALSNLGIAYAALGDAHKAIEVFEQALAIAHEIGDRHGEGSVLGNLGIAYKNLGERRKAIAFYERQLVIAREIGDRRGEGSALGNLGLAYADLGETRDAIAFSEQHLAITRELGDRRGEGNALGSLGSAYADLEQTREAIGFYEKRLLIAREIGDRRGEGSGLGNLGNSYSDLGDARKALEFYEQALVIARETGDRCGEGNSLWNSADKFWKLGDRAQAIARAEAALRIYEAIEDPHAAKVRARLAEWRKAGGGASI